MTDVKPKIVEQAWMAYGDAGIDSGRLWAEGREAGIREAAEVARGALAVGDQVPAAILALLEQPAGAADRASADELAAALTVAAGRHD